LALSLAYERVGQATDAYRAYRQVLTLEPAQADVASAVRDGRAGGPRRVGVLVAC
jgi:hypothetical protein